MGARSPPFETGRCREEKTLVLCVTPSLQHSGSMIVPVMSIREMRMGMYLVVGVPMSVLDPRLNSYIMLVQVLFVMYVLVLMFE